MLVTWWLTRTASSPMQLEAEWDSCKLDDMSPPTWPCYAGAMTKLGFSTDGPRWRYCSTGLNVEGICNNPACEAHEEMIIDMKVGSRLLTDSRLRLKLWSVHIQQLAPVFSAGGHHARHKSAESGHACALYL